MPKIAAALAVFLTVVTCIGYNSARYPVVWEMVALSDGFTRSRQSEPSAPFPESTDPPQSEGLATAASPGGTAPRRQSDWPSQEQSETASKSNTARPSSTYATYRDGGSSYQDESKSYDDSSYANESGSDANEHSGYTYDGSSGGSEDPAPRQTEDRGAAEKDKPADRVAMRQKRKRKGARNEAHGSQYAVDPVAPLQGATTSGGEDDQPAVGAGDVADEGDVSTQGLIAAERAAGPASEPVWATAGAKYASSPPGTVSPSSDASTYSDPDSHSTDSTQAGPAGESTADATGRGTLVPIKPAGPDGHGCEPPGDRSPGDALVAVTSGDSPSTCRVERLPPVDQVATLPGARPLDPHDALPVYPSAGGE